MLETAWNDTRYVARMLGRAPGFTAAAVLTLGIGIGATTAVFSVVHGVLLSPLPYPDPDALVRLGHRIGGVDQPYFSDVIYLSYADSSRALRDIGVWTPGETATITGQGEPEQVRTLTANRGLLTTLGVAPVVGRWLSPADDTPGSPDAVMLAYGYWQRRFGGDPAVVDRALVVDGRPHQIVGVMPAGFRFGGEFDLVRPLRIDPGAPVTGFRLLGVARLETGVSPAQLDDDVRRVLAAWFARAGVAADVQARWAPAPRPLARDVVGDVGRTLWVLLGAIGVVLLMACANVANLLLVRAEARRQELAIRAALGARWTRIASQLLAESLLLSLAGGVVGAGLAILGVRALVALGPAGLPRLHEIAVDPTALGFTAAIALASGLLFGLLPIVKHARPGRADGVLVGSRSATLSRSRQRSQHLLVVSQIGLALVLLVSAGLMIRSVRALRQVEPGFVDPARLQTFTITIPATLVPEAVLVTRQQQAVLDRIAALPGVTSAAFTTRLPFGSDRSSSAIAVEGRREESQTPPNRQVKVVSPGMFRTQGTPLVAGRDFAWDDVHGARRVAVVSENLAREIWGSAEGALGRRFREHYVPDSAWWEVVGVAGDVHDDGVDQAPPATVYWPAQPDEYLLGMDGYQARRVAVAVRSDRAGTASLLAEIRQAVWSVSPTLPLAQVRTLNDLYADSMARTSFTLVMLGLAASMALLLGLSGLYGVIAYAVAQRRREIGIRLALGARAAEIRRLFVRRGLGVAAVGVGLGLVGASAVTRLMQSLLFGVGPLDPITFVATPLALAAVAVLATYLPARRATAVDPVETLRAE
jgi:predicted permease